MKAFYVVRNKEGRFYDSNTDTWLDSVGLTNYYTYEHAEYLQKAKGGEIVVLHEKQS